MYISYFYHSKSHAILVKIQTRETVSRGVPMPAATILHRNRSFRAGSCSSVDARLHSRACNASFTPVFARPMTSTAKRPRRRLSWAANSSTRPTKRALRRNASPPAKIATRDVSDSRHLRLVSSIIVECRCEDRFECAPLAITWIRSYPPP